MKLSYQESLQTMSISVSINTQSGNEKTLWSWSVSLKNNKFGSTKTNSHTVGGLVAVYSALGAVPDNLDIIFRTRDKKLAEIISDPTRQVKNPIIQKIFKLIQTRRGFVRCIVISNGSLNDEDKRAIKILQTISGSSKSPTASRKPLSGGLLRPTPTKIKSTITKRSKRVSQPLSTGLEDWDDDGPTVIREASKKPVLCESCDAPISPLTNECLCSI